MAQKANERESMRTTAKNTKKKRRKYQRKKYTAKKNLWKWKLKQKRQCKSDSELGARVCWAGAGRNWNWEWEWEWKWQQVLSCLPAFPTHSSLQKKMANKSFTPSRPTYLQANNFSYFNGGYREFLSKLKVQLDKDGKNYVRFSIKISAGRYWRLRRNLVTILWSPARIAAFK